MFVWSEDEVRYHKLFFGKKPVISLNFPQAVELTYMKPKRNGKIILNNILSDIFRNTFTGAVVAGYLKRDADAHIRAKLNKKESVFIDYVQNNFGIKITYFQSVGYRSFLETVSVIPGVSVFSWVDALTKGTSSFGKRHKTRFIRCRRCGRRSYHVRHKVCSACGFGESSKIRQYSWQMKPVNRNRRLL